jgi:hypothetical protein
VWAAPDRFAGPYDEQVGVDAEAHQDLTHVTLGELENRAVRRVHFVEYATHSSPVRLRDILLRHA